MKRFGRLIAGILLASVVPTSAAHAALARIAGPTEIFFEPRLFVKFDVAYDEINKVYLVVWGTQGVGPTNGRFLNQSGVPISGVFPISEGAQQAGWARVAYSPEHGKFLVSYTKILGGGAHSRAARFVQYVGGAPSMPGEIIIDTWVGHAGGEPGLEYSAAAHKFVVTWWNWPQPFPLTYAAVVDPNTNSASSPTLISNPGDGESDPEIACDAASNRCLVAGYSWGVINGNLNTVWGRLLDATTGAPLGSVFVIDGAALESEPRVRFSPNGGVFVVTFVRDFKTVWSKTVSPAGALGAARTVSPAPNEAVDGGGYGTTNLATNPGTGTLAVVMQSWQAFPYAQELDAAGAPIPGSLVQIPSDGANFDQRSKFVVAAGDAGAKRFLLADNQRFLQGRASVLSTDGQGQTAPLQITSFAANTALPAPQGTPITWTATTSGGTAPIQFQFWRFSTATGWVLAQDYSTANALTWTPPAGTNAVQVWARSAGSGAAYDAYASTGNFTISTAGARLTSFTTNLFTPAPVHLPMTWTATAAGGTGPLQYQFWRFSTSTGWILGQDYSTNNSYTWFPLEGQNAMQVWVRSAGSTAAYEDYRSTGFFTITGAPQLTSFTANTAFPVAPGTNITFTAAAISHGGAVEYKFWGFNSATGTWGVMRDWSAINQLSWTPTAGGTYAVQVWLRSVGSVLTYEDWRGTEMFQVIPNVSLIVNTDKPLTGLRQGDVVTWMANVAEGGNWEYQFWGFNGSAWVLLQPYQLNRNGLSWMMTSGTRAVQVWIRAPGSNAAYDKYYSSGMFVVQ
jgi:hypothetical protein